MDDARTDKPVLRLLHADEQLHAITDTGDVTMVATDRRLLVAFGERVALDIGYPELRRVQFDIERKRPATLVIVPERLEPQVMAVPAERYDDVARALAVVGRYLAELD